MTEINFYTDNANGTINWAAAEQFKELENKVFKLGEMEATQIDKLENFSVTAKILLSAVAGAVIQHLIDIGIETETIFRNGSFVIKKSD